MFVGHLAVALAAKRAAPRVSLGWLMAGVTGLDLVWPVLVIAGIEKVRIVPGATASRPWCSTPIPGRTVSSWAVVWGLVLVAVAAGSEFRDRTRSSW
jgi:hypothetical protein